MDSTYDLAEVFPLFKEALSNYGLRAHYGNDAYAGYERIYVEYDYNVRLEITVGKMWVKTISDKKWVSCYKLWRVDDDSRCIYETGVMQHIVNRLFEEYRMMETKDIIERGYL